MKIALALMLAAQGALAGGVFPGEHWETASPAEVGLDAHSLESFSNYLQGRGCVVRHGKLVYTWGDFTAPGDVASAVKPWFSCLLMKAIELGKVPDLETKVDTFIPCLDSINADLNHKDSGIRLRHLATQTSCYGVSEVPGTAFDYNDWQMALFVDTLFLHVYGATYDTMDEAVLYPMLATTLGCEDTPTFESHRNGRLRISPRDFCRFGWLFLNEGRWGGDTILEQDHARMLVRSPLPGAFPRTQAIEAEMCPDQWSLGSERIPDNQCDHEGSYSFLWWINGVNRNGERHWPGAPLDVFAALGHHNGMRGMAVFPSLDMVASWNDTVIGDMPDAANPLNTAFGFLNEAAAAGPMEDQIVADPKHPAWLARHCDRDGEWEPFFLCGPGDPEGFLYRGVRREDGTRDGDQEHIIEKIKGTGANCIYLQAIRSHGGDGGATHNPFLDSDPAKGLDERILEQWETWFRALDDNGIVTFFIFYDDSAKIWPDGDTVPPEERVFLETIVRRFSHHRNWIWCVAEEYAEALSPTRVKAIASVIRNADKHQHVIAVHKNESLDFDEFAGDPNIGQFAAQWNKRTAAELHAGMLEAWERAGGRYNLTMPEADQFGFGGAAREKAWACAMAGAYVMAYGWLFDAPDAPAEDDLAMCGNLVRFFESTSFRDMQPHDELRAAGTDYVLANPGVAYILYAASGKTPLGVKELAEGSYRLTWFDTVSGTSIERTFVQEKDGTALLKRLSEIGGEVAVYVRKTS